MYRFLLFVFYLLWFINLNGQDLYNPNLTSDQGASILKKKNFYLFAAIENDLDVHTILSQQDFLKSFYRERNQKLNNLLNAEEVDAQTLLNTYLISDKEISRIGEHLAEISSSSNKISDFLNGQLRTSGKYKNFEERSNPEYLKASWNLCARGINNIIEVYGLGKVPRYPAMDSISYDPKSDYYQKALWMWSDMLQKKDEKKPLFYGSSLEFALALLYMNHRDEAERYEPLTVLNESSVKRIATTDFNKFPYTAIVILGNGPETYRDTLSAVGKLNLALGAQQFKAQRAPFIIVSGGHAHPYRTPFAEAVQMKEELIRRYKIDPECILVEPHARHTTINLRNATRLMVAMGIPIDKKALVVTNNLHSNYTSSDRFAERCREELGYLPATNFKRIDATTLEFNPKIESLQQNPLDPLDP